MPEVVEAVIVLLLFAVRIAIPIALTLAFGYWLERRLRPPETAPEAQKVHSVRKPSNIIRLQCWDIRRCDSTKRAQCAASRHPDLPCWLAIQVEGGKVRENCFTCAFYKPQVMVA